MAGGRSLSQQVVETGASRPCKADRIEKPIPALLSEIDKKLSGLFELLYHHERAINPILEQVSCDATQEKYDRPEPSQVDDKLKDISSRITTITQYLNSLTERSQL